LSNDYIFREYRNGDEKEIVDVLKTCFPEWRDRKNTLEYYTWKHLERPLGSYIKLVEKDNRILFVGHTGLLKIKIGEKVVLGSIGDDFATLPDYRGKGFFKNWEAPSIKKKMEMGVKFNYAITTNPIVIESNRKIGTFGFPQPLMHLILIRDIDLHIRQKGIENPVLMKIGYSTLKHFKRFSKLIKVKNSKDLDFSVRRISVFNESTDALWEAVKDSYSFIVEKKSDYMNWRFLDKRGGEYIVLVAERNERVYGYIVIGKSIDTEYGEGYIMDLLTLPHRIDVAGLLISEAIDVFEDMSVNAVHYRASKDSRYIDSFYEVGFLSAPRIMDTFIPSEFYDSKSLEEEFRAASSKRLHFNYGDYF
jgi:GNAT superfamily N-acetyltransferase